MDQLVQSVAFGRLHAVSDQQRSLFDTRNILGRFWSKDLSLWPFDETQLRVIQSNLTWVDLPDILEPMLLEISQAADDCVREGLIHWVFLALGSSSLAARATLPLVTTPLPVLFSVLDSSHPSAIRDLESRIDLQKAGFILANKAGDKLEDHALFLYFQKLLSNTIDSEIGRRFTSITRSNSFLAGISQGYTFRASFLDPPQLLSSYCSVIHFSALAACLSLMDSHPSLSSVRAMRELCQSASPSNPALQLAVFLSSAAVASCQYLVFLSSPALAAYSNRLGHLVGGSLAQEGCGLIPVCGDVPRVTEGIQDRAAFVFLTMEGQDDAELMEKLNAFRDSGVPFVWMQIRGAVDLLPETFKWEIAVALACAGLGFNPFDWPDVLQPRKIAMDLLERLSSDAHALDRTPRVQEPGIELFAEGRTRSEISNLNLPEALHSFFRLKDEGGFIVLLAFLERTPEVETSLWEYRELLARKLRVPVLLHYGPRCFDQYAYLCRSGVPHALYLMITADYPWDARIPGADYTFSQLHLSLVLGEFESKVQLESPHPLVIRLNLSGKLTKSLASLKRLLAQALPRNP